jgi:hypothetical protein
MLAKLTFAQNTLGHYNHNTLHSSGFRHDKGTLAIMKARRDRDPKRTLRLDKNVRRQMVRRTEPKRVNCSLIWL